MCQNTIVLVLLTPKFSKVRLSVTLKSISYTRSSVNESRLSLLGPADIGRQTDSALHHPNPACVAHHYMKLQ